MSGPSTTEIVEGINLARREVGPHIPNRVIATKLEKEWAEELQQKFIPEIIDPLVKARIMKINTNAKGTTVYEIVAASKLGVNGPTSQQGLFAEKIKRTLSENERKNLAVNMISGFVTGQLEMETLELMHIVPRLKKSEKEFPTVNEPDSAKYRTAIQKRFITIVGSLASAPGIINEGTMGEIIEKVKTYYSDIRKQPQGFYNAAGILGEVFDSNYRLSLLNQPDDDDDTPPPMPGGSPPGGTRSGGGAPTSPPRPGSPPVGSGILGGESDEQRKRRIALAAVHNIQDDDEEDYPPPPPSATFTPRRDPARYGSGSGGVGPLSSPPPVVQRTVGESPFAGLPQTALPPEDEVTEPQSYQTIDEIEKRLGEIPASSDEAKQLLQQLLKLKFGPGAGEDAETEEEMAEPAQEHPTSEPDELPDADQDETEAETHEGAESPSDPALEEDLPPELTDADLARITDTEQEEQPEAEVFQISDAVRKKANYLINDLRKPEADRDQMISEIPEYHLPSGDDEVDTLLRETYYSLLHGDGLEEIATRIEEKINPPTEEDSNQQISEAAIAEGESLIRALRRGDSSETIDFAIEQTIAYGDADTQKLQRFVDSELGKGTPYEEIIRMIEEKIAPTEAANPGEPETAPVNEISLSQAETFVHNLQEIAESALTNPEGRQRLMDEMAKAIETGILNGSALSTLEKAYHALKGHESIPQVNLIISNLMKIVSSVAEKLDNEDDPVEKAFSGIVNTNKITLGQVVDVARTARSIIADPKDRDAWIEARKQLQKMGPGFAQTQVGSRIINMFNSAVDGLPGDLTPEQVLKLVDRIADFVIPDEEAPDAEDTIELPPTGPEKTRYLELKAEIKKRKNGRLTEEDRRELVEAESRAAADIIIRNTVGLRYDNGAIIAGDQRLLEMNSIGNSLFNIWYDRMSNRMPTPTYTAFRGILHKLIPQIIKMDSSLTVDNLLKSWLGSKLYEDLEQSRRKF